MRQPLVAGNWKMNGSLGGSAELLAGVVAGAGAIERCAIAVCPPFPYLALAAQALRGSKVALGAQDLSIHEPGAYTGEVAGSMLKDFGCTYVIVGHSERRQYHGEDDLLIARKYARAVDSGLIPILCVGETLEQRELGETERVVAAHVDGVINLSGVDAFRHGVIAYEPVWAIGTGVTATPAQAEEVHAFIRARVAAKSQEVAAGLRILYGGSMKPGNAAELMAQPDIDGGLIGGASLVASEFLAIARAAGESAA
ncbi:MAG: triose-phosphate isomerase [Bdellovibrio bacteriovorus]